MTNSQPPIANDQFPAIGYWSSGLIPTAAVVQPSRPGPNLRLLPPATGQIPEFAPDAAKNQPVPF